MSTEKEIKNEATVVASAEQTANAEVQTPKKRRGRGINNDLRDVTRKKFDERTDCNKANGLFIGHLEDVKVDWATLKDDVQGMPSFAGMSIPYLTFTFASNHENINERRYVTQRLLPAESNVETIPGGKGAWKVDNIFRFMKHIYNVFVLKGRDLTEEEIDAEIAKLAEQYQMEADQIKKAIPTDQLASDVKTKKAIDLIVDSAVKE